VQINIDNLSLAFAYAIKCCDIGRDPARNLLAELVQGNAAAKHLMAFLQLTQLSERGFVITKKKIYINLFSE